MIPEEQNELADFYSRIVDYDDWMLNSMVFVWLDSLGGPHTTDRFASPRNAIRRFNSKFWTAGTEVVDAFICNWAEDNNWWVPQVHLICTVARHA